MKQCKLEPREKQAEAATAVFVLAGHDTFRSVFNTCRCMCGEASSALTTCMPHCALPLHAALSYCPCSCRPFCVKHAGVCVAGPAVPPQHE